MPSHKVIPTWPGCKMWNQYFWPNVLYIAQLTHCAIELRFPSVVHKIRPDVGEIVSRVDLIIRLTSLFEMGVLPGGASHVLGQGLAHKPVDPLQRPIGVVDQILIANSQISKPPQYQVKLIHVRHSFGGHFSYALTCSWEALSSIPDHHWSLSNGTRSHSRYRTRFHSPSSWSCTWLEDRVPGGLSEKEIYHKMRRRVFKFDLTCLPWTLILSTTGGSCISSAEPSWWSAGSFPCKQLGRRHSASPWPHFAKNREFLRLPFPPEIDQYRHHLSTPRILQNCNFKSLNLRLFYLISK